MKHPRRLALAAPFATLIAARAAAQDGVITGTVTYRERMALPPGTVLEVRLLDVSRADAPAGRIATARIAVSGQVPLTFALRYDPARVDPRNAYALEARLLIDGRPAFRNERLQPVLTRGAGAQAEILLLRVGMTGGPAGLTGAPWIAEEIGGRAVPEGVETTITFGADARAYGSGGCNRFNGGFTVHGASLRFGPMSSTNMACAEAAMEQEQRFHAALAAVRGYRIANAVLHLLDASGGVLVRCRRGRDGPSD